MLLALEWAKAEGCFTPFHAELYESYWLEGLNVNELEVLGELAADLNLNADSMLTSVESQEHAGKIIPFDEASYEAGVYNVPTYFIGSLKLAEQPLPVLRSAIKLWLEQQG